MELLCDADSILFFPNEKGFHLHSGRLLLGCLTLAHDVLGSFLSVSLSPVNKGLNLFPYLGFPFSMTVYPVADVFPLIVML